jgi:hypothetical protein
MSASSDQFMDERHAEGFVEEDDDPVERTLPVYLNHELSDSL